MPNQERENVDADPCLGFGPLDVPGDRLGISSADASPGSAALDSVAIHTALAGESPDRETTKLHVLRKRHADNASESHRTRQVSQATFEIGQRLQELRRARGWSQRDLASAASSEDRVITQAHVQRMEKGASWTVDNLILIARTLDVPASVLLGEDSGGGELSPQHSALLRYLVAGDLEKFFLVLAPLLPRPSGQEERSCPKVSPDKSPDPLTHFVFHLDSLDESTCWPLSLEHVDCPSICAYPTPGPPSY